MVFTGNVNGLKGEPDLLTDTRDLPRQTSSNFEFLFEKWKKNKPNNYQKIVSHLPQALKFPWQTLRTQKFCLQLGNSWLNAISLERAFKISWEEVKSQGNTIICEESLFAKVSVKWTNTFSWVSCNSIQSHPIPVNRIPFRSIIPERLEASKIKYDFCSLVAQWPSG